MKNAEFRVHCKSRELSRKSPIFRASFRIFIWNNQNSFQSFRNSCEYIELKLVQKVRDLHTYYEIGLENKKFSEKFQDFQKQFQSFSKIVIHFKRNA